MKPRIYIVYSVKTLLLLLLSSSVKLCQVMSACVELCPVKFRQRDPYEVCSLTEALESALGVSVGRRGDS